MVLISCLTFCSHLNIFFINSEAPEEENFIRAVNEQFNIMPQDVKSFLPICPYGTAQRCLVTARLFGDESEVDFWTVALFYLKSEKTRLTCPLHKVI